jgi:O-antigen/teichoic acid export membrane protein
LSQFEIGNESIRAGTVLIVSNLLSAVILVINVLVIARLLGPNLYGEYTLALLPPTIFVVFAGIGINTAVTRFSALHLSKNEIDIAKRKTANGMTFLLILSLILSLVSFLLASIIANYIFHRPNLAPYVELTSISVFGQVMFQAGISALVGWSVFRYAGLSYVIQSSFKLALSVGLVVSGLGVIGALAGQVTGQIIAALSAISIIYFLKLAKSSKLKDQISQMYTDLKDLINFGFPSEFGSYVSNFAGLYFVVIILGHFVSNPEVGYFQAAANVTFLISIVATSISLSLLPGFTRLHGKEGNTGLGFSYAVKYVAYLGTPLILFLAAASGPIVLLVYGRLFQRAAELLALISISNLPMIIGQSIFPAYFNAIGRTRFTMYAFLADAAAAIVLAPILGYYFGAIGITFALLGSNLASGLVALFLAKKYLKSGINYKSSLSALIASLVCFGATFEIPFLNISLVIVILLQATVFFGLYILIAPALKVVGSEDVRFLRQPMAGMGIIGKPIVAILDVESALMKRMER